MFFPERYRLNPPPPRPSPAPEPAAASPAEPAPEVEDGDWDDADEAQLSDEDFLRELRADVAGVHEGLIPSKPSAQARKIVRVVGGTSDGTAWQGVLRSLASLNSALPNHLMSPCHNSP
jgi:hypothetical protein